MMKGSLVRDKLDRTNTVFTVFEVIPARATKTGQMLEAEAWIKATPNDRGIVRRVCELEAV